MNTSGRALSTLRRLGIAIAIAVLFLFGLATTVYLSLRSPEVMVPDVVGKDRFEAERVLGDAGLNFRVRATRPSQLKADTVLFQLPRGGEVVKAGQTVAMDISRTVKEGESSAPAVEATPDEKTDNRNTNEASPANENKPKRNKNTNKNANDNSNAKPGNRNANNNRPATNKNVNSGNSNNANLNSNRPPSNANTNPTRNVNDNGTKHAPAAKPSPVSPTKEN